MGPYIVNAAPMVIDLGTQDLSTVPLPRVPESLPQFLPKFYLYTQKGPSTPQLVGGAERDNMFGTSSFDPLGPYFNHATLFANGVDSQGTQCMIQRIVPVDAGPNANFLLSLDVLATQVPLYQRNTDGSITLDTSGNPVPTGTNVAGYKVHWVLTSQATVATLQTEFGLATIGPGDQTNTVTAPAWAANTVYALNATITVSGNIWQATTAGTSGATAPTWPTTGLTVGTTTQVDNTVTWTYEGPATTQSQRYPILEFQANSQGAWGNLAGIRIWAPNTETDLQFPSTMMTSLREFPYYIQMVLAPNAQTSPAIVPTILNDQYVMFTLKPNSIDPTTAAQLYIGDVVGPSYSNTTDPTYPPVYGNFSQMSVYQNNIDTVLGLFYATESTQISAWSDIAANAAATDKYLINIANFVSSQNSPYATILPVTTTASVSLTQYSNLMAENGSDGTMSDTLFDGLVNTQLLRYLDPNDSVQNIVQNPESIFLDSGFSLTTKESAAAIIAVRRDTFVALSTYSADNPVLTQDQEMSTATALLTRLQMYPESDYFGTEVMRGMIIGYSANVLNSQWTEPAPLTYEFALKAAAYMGAGNGAWKTGYSFDGAPGSVFQYMTKPSISWLPATVRNKAWSVGLNWAQDFDRRSVFFPALKTVYGNDTSVLNSFFVAMACCTINKITHAAWQQFTGREDLTNAQLADATNAYISARVQGIFDNRYIIKPQAFFTDADVARGYSWTTPVQLYANNMKTVMTTYVQAYRMSALSTTSATNP